MIQLGRRSCIIFSLSLTETYSGVRVGKNISDMFPMRIELAQDRNRWRALVDVIMNLRFPENVGNFLTS
jgi:hypothetical protein